MSDELEELDIEALLIRLAPVQMAARLAIDRYRDFRKVFLTTDEGRRVLDDILWLGQVSRPLDGRGDPYVLHASEGRRRMALTIAAITHVEPPSEAVSRDPKRDDNVAANRKWIKG